MSSAVVLPFERSDTERTEIRHRPSRTSRLRALPWSIGALLAIIAGQIALALRPSAHTATPFADEALYTYIGHRMWEHVLHGTLVTEYPGSYLSGAPGLFPMLAAIGDHLDGIEGARAVALLFSIGCTICVYGMGTMLYGRLAGVIGAGAFVLNGPMIYISHFATFDSMSLFFVAAASWLTIYSVRTDRFAWASAVSLLLVLAFYSKYATYIYVPVVAALALAVARAGTRLTVSRRIVVMAVSALVFGYFILLFWGNSLVPGINYTTLQRHPHDPQTSWFLIRNDVLPWVGPWIVLAVLGALVTRRTWMTSLVLLGGSLIFTVGQVRLGEETSFTKHVGFGMIYACPLIGAFFSRLIARRRAILIAIPAMAAVAVVLAQSGMPMSRVYLTDWPDDTPLLPVLAQTIRAHPGLIMGEIPNPERYALPHITKATNWDSTDDVEVDGKTGLPGYRLGMQKSVFSIIYLMRPTDDRGDEFDPTSNGAFIYSYLNTHQTPYHLVKKVAIYQDHVRGGSWYIYVKEPVKTPTVTPALPRASVLADTRPLPPSRTGWALTASR